MNNSTTNQIPFVDQWVPQDIDIIFTNSKNIIVAPLSEYYHTQDDKYSAINYFMINTKKSYNSDLLRNHNNHYLNYFEKYFDAEKEYFTNMAYLKFVIDYYPEYRKENFINDLNRYILQPSIYNKIYQMVQYNYNLSLSYKSDNNPQLQYTNEHGQILMEMSIMMNLIIPLITHFAYIKRITDIDEYLLDIYDNILYAPVFNGVDIYAKLYETAISNVTRNEKNNTAIWMKQDIRGKDVVTHSLDAVKNIIINIMPKYTFDKNMVSLDYTSIQKSNKFQITDIAYEYSYIPLSSSKREGDDNSSDFDRFEANLIKADESIYLQAKINCEYNMKHIEEQWGPFDQAEIEFYMHELRNDKGEIINGFQRELVFNLFYKYFGDTTSIYGINSIQYIELIIAARRMLQQRRMAYMPYIISSKVQKMVSRKSLNKKELQELQTSQYYPMIVERFKNQKDEQQFLGTVATIITSTFTFVDYTNPEINGKIIDVEPRILLEEAPLYVLLI